MSSQTRELSARVFFALWPDDAERAALAAWQPVLHKLCGGRSMRADTLHATLAFLGNVVQHRLEALQLAAQEVAGAPFDLTFDVAHYWGHNHIVYAAPHAVPPQLMLLVQALEQSLGKHHFHFDKRPYKPHITVLRHAQWSDAPLPEMQKVVWRIRSYALIQSAPNAEGANYKVLARFTLNRQAFC